MLFNAKTFAPDSYGSNVMGYAGPANTASSKDYLSLKRTAAKPTTTFSGVSRTESKLTRTLDLPVDALQPAWDAIITVSSVIPVGATAADILALRQDIAGYVASADFLAVLQNNTVAFA